MKNVFNKNRSEQYQITFASKTYIQYATLSQLHHGRFSGVSLKFSEQLLFTIFIQPHKSNGSFLTPHEEALS